MLDSAACLCAECVSRRCHRAGERRAGTRNVHAPRIRAAAALLAIDRGETPTCPRRHRVAPRGAPRSTWHDEPRRVSVTDGCVASRRFARRGRAAVPGPRLPRTREPIPCARSRSVKNEVTQRSAARSRVAAAPRSHAAAAAAGVHAPGPSARHARRRAPVDAVASMAASPGLRGHDERQRACADSTPVGRHTAADHERDALAVGVYAGIIMI